MSEEPPKKKRKQTMNDSQEPDKAQHTKRAVKRVESANNPSLLPQVFHSQKFSLIFFQKKYYRQRAHANVLSDHALV